MLDLIQLHLQMLLLGLEKLVCILLTKMQLPVLEVKMMKDPQHQVIE